jgi:hypothetical protein
MEYSIGYILRLYYVGSIEANCWVKRKIWYRAASLVALKEEILDVEKFRHALQFQQ